MACLNEGPLDRSIYHIKPERIDVLAVLHAAREVLR
jgi:plasmid stabilization system protein ParE